MTTALLPVTSDVMYSYSEFPSCWCVVEYWTKEHIDAEWRFTMLYVCELRQAYTFHGLYRNPVWRDMVKPDMLINARVTHVGDVISCRRHMDTRLNTMPVKPPANVHPAHWIMKVSRLECSNGQTYRNQSEAARQLGLTQSAISKHLAGGLDHVKNYRFRRVE